MSSIACKIEMVKILMVEDDLGYRTFTKHLLKNHEQSIRFEFIGVGSLAEGCNVLQSETVDVVLLDLNLPDSTGLTNIEKILKVSGGVPIIVLTGRDDESSGLLALGLGAQDFLLKHKIGDDSLIRCIRYSIERRKFEESKLRLSAIKDFTSTLAHDLQVPMIGSNNVLDSLLNETSLAVEQKQLLEVLRSSNQTQLSLVQKLLTLYKYECESSSLKFESVNLATLIMTCLSKCLSSCQPANNSSLSSDSNRSRINLKLGQKLPRVLGDYEALECMFRNLIDNALKFSPDDSSITISSEFTESKLAVCIHNYGQAIPAEMMSVLFERFWQGIPGKSYVSHTGLGLYLCQRVASIHRARLVGRSNEAEGTTMTVHFPLNY